HGCKKTRLVIGFFYRSGTELVALTGMKQSVSNMNNSIPDMWLCQKSRLSGKINVLVLQAALSPGRDRI
ncbi:TPA: hypothetical protein ACG1TJ_004552, partial [Salmonella enterica]